MGKFIPGKTKILYGGALLGKEENLAIKRVLKKGWWGLDFENDEFEKELARVQKVKRAVFVNSGSSALDLGIRALNLPKGSEVIVPACTFPTPIASLIREGLVPVVADIEPGTNFFDLDSLEKSITQRTRAVLAVYITGNPGNLDGLLSHVKQRQLILIEDNCEGFGGSWKGKLLGSFGEFSATSTHPAHIISTGEGGVFFSDNQELADRVLSMRDWGRQKDGPLYFYTNLGSNYRPLELQAAIGRVQLKKLAEFKKRRGENFQSLIRGLANLSDKLTLPKIYKGADPCWYSFPLVLKNEGRDNLTKLLEKAKIEWRPILAGNILDQPAFKGKIKIRVKTPNADLLNKNGFWVSVHPTWDNRAMEYIVSVIRSYFNQ